MLTIKQIFHYQVISKIYFFQMRNESKNNKFVFNCFFFKIKTKDVRV